jgi:DNA polymerase-3 subunit delta
MGPKAVSLLAEHIGNDLSRISNEIDKLAINLDGRKNIDEDDIEKYIGISKEYNVFELQAAIARKDLRKPCRSSTTSKVIPKPVRFRWLCRRSTVISVKYTLFTG